MMSAGWEALSLLQKAAVVLLAWLALTLVFLGLWGLIIGPRRADDEEFREAVHRKVRDDEQSGKNE